MTNPPAPPWSGEPASVPISSRVPVAQIGLYFLLLLLASNLSGSLCSIPINFFFKDQLKLGPERIALFGFLQGIPAYFGFLLGLLRDRWQPWGGQDRGYLLALPPLTAFSFLWLAYQPLSYGSILAVMLFSGVCGVLLGAAIQGLMAATAQRHALSGRLSSAFGVAVLFPLILGNYAGGWLTAHVRPQTVFQLAAGIVMIVLVFALWRPATVYAGAVAPSSLTSDALLQTVSRLARHRPLYLPAIILFLWNFAPGWNTPLFFYLTDHVKLSSEAYGTLNSLQLLTNLLFWLLYGLLCRRYSLRPLLWAGVILGVAGGPLYWFIHTPTQAYGVGILAGASCGIANGAFTDLLLRSCPKGAEGVTMALAGGAVAFATATADIFGSWLYARGGFGLALIVSTLVCVVIALPVLAIPHHLMVTRDGENLPEVAVGDTT